MPQTNITTWLEFALQQMAAESYLDGINRQDNQAVIDRLVAGNNAPGVSSPNPGATRFVNLTSLSNASQIIGSAQAFVAHYQIVDHHANDATGFSATLMRNNQTGEYTLSFRSTEYKNQVDGGDYERDGANGLFLTGADGEIVTKGFALGQLAAMEDYFNDLKQGLKADGSVDATLQAFFANGGKINVTGYSLGAHLATVFTEMHAAEVIHTYTFNGPGRGTFNVTLSDEAAEAQRMQQMISKLTLVLLNPDAGLSTPRPPDDQLPFGYILAKNAQQADPTFNPFAAGNTASVYNDARYLWAKEVVSAQFGPLSSGAADIARTDGAFSLITQIVGHASQGDTEYVANSGNHAAETRVFIEDQPNLDGFGGFFGANGDFGTTHSITLIVDSLATQELFQTVAPTLTQPEVEAVMSASSNERATGFTVGSSGTAEAKSLEHAVDALRRLFLPGPVSETTADPATGGFGNLANRNTFYTNMAAVKAAVIAQQSQNVTFNIQNLTDPSVTLAVLSGTADTDTDQGLAYRYALKELNPFAIVANTPQANEALYASHNDQGQLDRFNLADGTGSLTSQYLTDRALFLAEKIALNQLDQDTTTRSIHFQDVASTYEIKTPLTLALAQREFLFGSDTLDTLTGGSKDDRLYGGGSVDVLIGNAGRDYLEGNGGSDRLEGGAGADNMIEGAGNDTYLVDDLGDQVLEVGDHGTTDTVESSVTFSLAGTTVEHLTLTGTANLNGTGNELDNEITGNSGINRLDGQGGTDHLLGGLGNDVLIGGMGDGDLLEGGAGFDTYLYNAGDESDRIERDVVKLALTS
ncbi:MAG: hypothetical protein Q8N04_15690 [Nitrospira sp.]|nr:hypothetical protein [Nitrospira sp.]